MTNFYLAFAIRGEQREEANNVLEYILEIMQSMGKVLNEKIVKMHLNKQGEEGDNDVVIQEIAMDMVKKTDVMVSIYAHSFGVGFEAGWHTAYKRKIICLISRRQEEEASAMCKGNFDIIKLVYDSTQHAEALLKQALREIRP